MSDLFQITGVSSGIGWDEIINKMMEKGRKPATQWQNQIDTLEVKKTLYQELQSYFNKLRNTLTPLRLANAYKAKTVQYTGFSSDIKPENIVTAKIGADAELTWWDIEVKKLARAQRHTTTRFDSVSEALGISGEFRIRVGKQTATIKIEKEDNLREINYKISKAVDQDGNPIAVTAKILDNRIVLESARPGLGSSGDTRGVSFTMGSGNDYYLPHSSIQNTDGTYSYPRQIFQLSYNEPNVDGSTFTYNYVEGRDFTYDEKLGKITWIERKEIKNSSGVVTSIENPDARRPPKGAEFEAIYSEWLNSSRTDTFYNRDGDKVELQPLPGDFGTDTVYDILPFLPTGKDYEDISEGNFVIIGADGKEYKQGLDFEIVDYAMGEIVALGSTSAAIGPPPAVGDPSGSYQAVRWLDTATPISLPIPPGGTHDPERPAGAYTIRIGADNEDRYAYDENVFYLEPVTWASDWQNVTRQAVSAGNPDALDVFPSALTAKEYSGARFEIKSGSNTYVQGVDFDIVEDTVGGVTRQYIKWIDTPPAKPSPAAGVGYEIRAVVENDYSETSVLARLGFITVDPHKGTWDYAEGYVKASDAEFEVDGVKVTRSSNTVDDLIANVTLELRGIGQVRLNIVRDLEKTVEEIDKFVEEYNSVMEWINFYVSQKQDGTNPVDETDHLSSILQQSRGNTVFGVLHGDQLLWSIKNQLRSRLSSPIATLSASLTSRKVVNTASSMNIKSSFYVYVAGKAAKVTVEPTDSMEDIQRKIADARNVASSDGHTAGGGTLGLNVTIRDGQLVIDGPSTSSSTTGDRENTSATITRGEGGSSDYLSFIPVTSQPVSGELKVFSGRNPYTEGQSTLYREGIDYRVVTSTENDVVSSRIEWMEGKGPQAKSVYFVSYDYYPNAVAVAEIPGSGPIGNEIAKGWNDLSFLELRQDSSKIMMSAFGITTENMDYGKSGLLEFDSEKFLSMMESDPDLSANAMLTFMRDFDTYIGNLVDSSQILVAGTPVTKGRIAGALQKIDTEQNTLNARITKLEKELEAKQTALYKQYSDMEVAIQKLNAQMNSIANYLNSMNNKN